MNILKSLALNFLLFNTVFCSVQLRHATIEDVQALVLVHHNSWHATYDHMLPAVYCTKNNADHLLQYWHKFFGKHDGRFVLIAEDENNPVGFITAGPIKHIEQEIEWWPCTGYDCEIYKLYVLPEYQGKGIGKLLLESAFAQLWQYGYRKPIVRVFAQNTSARGFYAHCTGIPLHTAPVTYWPELPYYVYGFSIGDHNKNRHIL